MGSHYGSVEESAARTPERRGSVALRTALALSVLASLAFLALVILTPSTNPFVLLPKLVCGKMLCSDSEGSWNLPAQYEDSFSIFPEEQDGTEAPTLFNGADPSGSSWRQYVPMLIWPDEDWFDQQGNYIGRGGVPDPRKATVTRQIPGPSQYLLLQERR